jgi:hypothetical protein
MAITYPIYSNQPYITDRDPKRDMAWRLGHSKCLQWINTSLYVQPGVIPERPKNPYLDPFNGFLADAWEDGWTAATLASKGRGF